MSERDPARARMLAALAMVSWAACANEEAASGALLVSQSDQSSAGSPAAPTPEPRAGAASLAGFSGSSRPIAAVGGSTAGRAASLPGSAGTVASTPGVAGVVAAAGGALSTGGVGGVLPSTAGQLALAGSGAAAGACCSDGDCLCHGPAPTELTTSAGPYKTERTVINSGTLHYPTDAEPPFAAVALCGGFLNTGPEMDAWGPLYASHGIVTVIVTTDGADVPDIRAARLLAAIEELKELGAGSTGPLASKLSGRYGTSGYSMGGGGTTLASGQAPELKTSIGLAAWGGSAVGVKVPTLLLCGDADTVAPCNMSQSVYTGIEDTTPKMLITIAGVTHFDWFGPTDAGRGISGSYALAFQKVYLEGDTRWKPLLLEEPTTGSVVTNID